MAEKKSKKAAAAYVEPKEYFSKEALKALREYEAKQKKPAAKKTTKKK